MRYLRFLALPVVFVAAAWSARADSLWSRRDPRSAFLFVDSRARRVGDVLTIVIEETTGVDNKDERQMSKDTKAGGILGFKGSTTAGKLSRAGQVDVDVSGSSTRSFDGKSQYSVGRHFQERVSVTVVDVLPNGNLVITPYRRRVVSGEERLTRLSGIVRPIDVALDNTVQSQFIANLQVDYVGRGAESRFTNQNYFGRVLNYLWPF